MFGLGFGEIVIILVLALVLLGPQKLPEVAKQLGKGLRDFKKASDDLKGQFEKEFYAEERKAERARVAPPTASAPVPTAPPGPVPVASAIFLDSGVVTNSQAAQASREVIQAWLDNPNAVSAENASSKPTLDILPLDCFLNVQQVFATAMEVGVTTMDVKGEMLIEPSSGCEFCRRVLNPSYQFAFVIGLSNFNV